MIDEVRERLAHYGSNALTNADLLRLAVGAEEATALLEYFSGDIYALYRADPADMAQAKGIGKAKAERLHAALSLGARAVKERKERPARIGASADAYQAVAPYLADLMHEEFWVLLLNRSNGIIDVKQISKGGVAGTVADPKLIFNAAILAKASAIILTHNHPSGNMKPSQADIQLTKKLKKSGELLEISVLDHIIYTDGGYFSFNDEGLM